ncbi:hypothetical protein NQ176_g6666 [Zarea fungicola]|uniref:Uncharacterized protein n=1 Tax=Zarea fungicola TaxID=93591 RepID=A0ACC1N228_9HYPO|nr:hypothetical protein NQ176_g6666 [Lecanicillium fungicola]
MSLISRLSIKGQDDDPEDFLSSALGTIFPDDVTNLHGEPGDALVYTSPHLAGPLVLRLCEPADDKDRRLFSHYVWNSSLLLAELMEADTLGVKGAGEGRITDVSFDVKGQSVIELGAGTGLAGIMASLLGASRLAITDYPASSTMAVLRDNVSCNVNAKTAPQGYTPTSALDVQGHAWGSLDDAFSIAEKHAFDRVICADVLWMPWQHDNLRRSIAHFLSHAAGARCWIIAGLHTGRDKITQFLNREALEKAGLKAERIWERDCNGLEREWEEERDDDFTYRKRWLILAVLKRI